MPTKATGKLLMPHQEEAARKLRNGCILKGDVGTGKSRTALAYYSDNENVEHLYIITTARKRDSGDWQEEARLFGVFPVVDSWNNLARYEGVENAFFIFDEQRVVGSGVWVQAFLKIARKNQWVLLSATPGDSWMDYIPVFIANGFYKNRTEFCREHVVFSPYTKYPRVERWNGTAKLAGLLSRILIDMPFEKNVTRHETEVFAEYDRALFDTVWRKRWNYLEDRPVRHVSELFSLMRRVVNTDPSRIQRVRDLMILHPKIIIFYNFDYELELLRGLDTVKAEWNGHKHESIPKGEEWAYLVQYAAGAEAWNSIDTNAILFFSLSYSYRLSEQARGRIDRLNTIFSDLFYYVIRSSSMIDNGIAKALREKRSFNEKDFLRSAL